MCVSVGRIYQRFLSRAEAIRDLRVGPGRLRLDLEDGSAGPLIDLPELDSHQEWERISNETLARAHFEYLGESVTVLDSSVC